MSAVSLQGLGATEPRDLEAWIASSNDPLFGRSILWLTRQDGVSVENRSDLLGIDAEGALCVVELKRGTATEAALTQALVYAAGYRNLELSDLAARLSEHSQKEGASALFSERLSEEDARAAIENHIAAMTDEEVNERQVIMIIAEDFSANLLDAADYLATRTDGAFEVECWRLQCFGSREAPAGVVIDRVFPAESTAQAIETRREEHRRRRRPRNPARRDLIRQINEHFKTATTASGHGVTRDKRRTWYQLWLKPEHWPEESTGVLISTDPRWEVYVEVRGDHPEPPTPPGAHKDVIDDQPGIGGWYVWWPNDAVVDASTVTQAIASILERAEPSSSSSPSTTTSARSVAPPSPVPSLAE